MEKRIETQEERTKENYKKIKNNGERKKGEERNEKAECGEK